MKPSDPKESPQLKVASLCRAAFDAWIYLSRDTSRVFFVPGSPEDADLARRHGLVLAANETGLDLVHRGHETEST